MNNSQDFLISWCTTWVRAVKNWEYVYKIVFWIWIVLKSLSFPSWSQNTDLETWTYPYLDNWESSYLTLNILWECIFFLRKCAFFLQLFCSILEKIPLFKRFKHTVFKILMSLFSRLIGMQKSIANLPHYELPQLSPC